MRNKLYRRWVMICMNRLGTSEIFAPEWEMHISIRKPSAGWKVRGGDAESKALLRARPYGSGLWSAPPSCKCHSIQLVGNTLQFYVFIPQIANYFRRARARTAKYIQSDGLRLCCDLCSWPKCVLRFRFFFFFFKSKTMCGGVRVISMIDLEWRAIMRLLTIVVCWYNWRFKLS